MDVKFTNTTSSKLNSLSIVNGQLVALSDKSGLYYDLGGKRYKVGLAKEDLTGAISTVLTDNLNANIVPISNASGKLVSSNITATQLGYLSGVTSNIQTQLNGKAPSNHNHDATILTNFSWCGEWKQNLDVAPGNYTLGCYWVTSVTSDPRYVQGTHAFTGTFYYLFIFASSPSVQIAVEYYTGIIRSRCYVNNVWNNWTVMGIEQGGTGATNAAQARTNLGLGSAATCPHTTSAPSSGSSALITSGAVYNALVSHTHNTVELSNFTWKLKNNSNAHILLNDSHNLKSYITSNGADFDNSVTLGTSSARFKQLFAGTATISTSDRNLKDNIEPLTDIHKQFFMKLLPVSFTFKDGESGRTHIGFIAQDIEDAMNELGLTSSDFAGFCKDVLMKTAYKQVEVEDADGNTITKDIEYEVPFLNENENVQYRYSLRYEEFIGLITHVLQDTMKELQYTTQLLKNTNIDARLADIEARLAKANV